MIIVMNPNASIKDIQAVTEALKDMGLRDQIITGTDLTVVAAIGDDRKKDKNALEQLPGVNRVVPILAPYKLAARAARPGKETTQVKLNDGCTVGGKQVAIIAGPCSVESESQIIDAAKKCKAAGAHALRGGAFKPRTNPYSFQGLGEAGLKLLAQARQETGLAIVTEVLTPAEVDLVAKYADCLQIGARNAQNFKLLEAAGKSGKPVLYKRGMSMTIDEYLQAAEYILAAGNPNVILCERGIRTFEDHTRNTLSLSVVPDIHQKSHLPIIIDPSQGTGHARLVPAMCNAAVACGADGLIIEVHPDPAHAMTDGAQSITPDTLAKTISVLAKIASAVDRSI